MEITSRKMNELDVPFDVVDSDYFIVGVYLDENPESPAHIQVLEKDEVAQRCVRIRDEVTTYQHLYNMIDVMMDEFSVTKDAVRIGQSDIIPNAKNN